MSIIFECKNICKEYGDRVILKAINLEIIEGEKLGIVGDNGAGKTTLANIISGESSPTSGKLQWYKTGLDIGFMKQATEYQYRGDNKEGAPYLEGVATLSGGERTKKILNQILYSKRDVLLLDEPTNHLDSEGIKWLIKSIKGFKGTVIMISHDRYFLDECAERILEIDHERVKSYIGNYSNYREEKKRQFKSNLHNYMEQEKLKGAINKQISQLKGWSQDAHKDSAKKAIETGNKFGGKEHNRAKAKKMDQAVKSRLKRLEKIEVGGLSKPQEETTVNFNIEQGGKTGAVVVIAEEINKKFDNKTLFKSSSFYIKMGEHIGLYGNNGCGKSTLIKAMLGQEEVEGKLKLNLARRIGYMSQDVLDLDEEQTVLELFGIITYEEESQIRSQLIQLGFTRSQFNEKIGALSLGERMKLKLLLMIKEECEVLILDEPTNHMDLHMREQLEEALSAYKGTLILVTHDRYMLDKLCDKLLVFDNSQIKRYEGGIKEYLARQEHMKDNDTKDSEAEKLRLENRLAYLIGELSITPIGTKEYEALDSEYQQVINQLRTCKG